MFVSFGVYNHIYILSFTWFWYVTVFKSSYNTTRTLSMAVKS